MTDSFLYRLLLMMLYLSISGPLWSQEKTIELKPVTVTGQPFAKYAPGSKVQQTDSLVMTMLGQGTLTDLLTQNTPIYIKEYGNRSLSTISFRGTGASHTGVYWQGLNLNALTLGHSDFNSYSLYLFDDISVQYGGASSLYGTDAIGGSVHLNTKPKYGAGLQTELRQDIGSFGNIFTGIKLDGGSEKWSSKTRFFNFNLKNNFRYAVTDRLGDVYQVEQENASVHNYALLQEIHRKLKNHNSLSLQAWYGYNYRQAQPLMVTQPDEPVPEEDILNKNLRIITKYEHVFKKGLLEASGGYLWDYQLYDNQDIIETKRLVGILKQEIDISERSTIKFGGDIQYIMPKVHAYEEDLTELRGDLFVSFIYALKSNWHLAVNGRKAFVPHLQPPLAPSITTSYKIQLGPSFLTIRGQAERSYRIPTFNDRYWGIQGRKDLEAENGYSGELGANYAGQFSEELFFDLDISGYYMIVDNWISWQPAGGIWRPYNLKKVRASGIELGGSLTFHQPWGQVRLNGQFAYNRSVLLEGVNEDDQAIGHQLPYTPTYRGVLNGTLLFKSFRLGILNYYIGERNGQDVVNEVVEAYFLTNLNVGKNIRLGNHLLAADFQILNVFNTEYQNVKRYAMPGRNYLVSFKYCFNKYKP